MEDILQSAKKVVQYTRGMDEAEFVRNDLAFDAALWNFMISGEATRHVPLEVQRRYPEVPWAEMRGMRNLLAHEYFGASRRVVWDTVARELPSLIPLLRRIVDENR